MSVAAALSVRGRPRITTAPATILCLLAAAAPVAVYLWIAAHRAGYPYELDWMEGGSVELAARVLHGQSLYASPTLAFVGWTYPPLYYWASAAVAAVTGIGFLPLRLVSILGSLLAMGAVAAIIDRRSGDRIAAAVGAGLFTATFALTGAWFDIGRVDSLFTGVTLLAILAGARARSTRGGIAAGAVAFLAAFTKQSALVALLPALGVLAVGRPRAGVSALVTLAVLFGGSVLVLDALTGGWYRYYVFDELAGQAWAPGFIAGFWRDDLLAHLWPLAVLGLCAGVLEARAARAGAVRDRPRAGAFGTGRGPGRSGIGPGPGRGGIWRRRSPGCWPRPGCPGCTPAAIATCSCPPTPPPRCSAGSRAPGCAGPAPPVSGWPRWPSRSRWPCCTIRSPRSCRRRPTAPPVPG